MSMNKSILFKTLNTLFFSICFLFFIQLTGSWIENIYRMSLVKLSPGKELFGLLCIFLPMIVLFVKENHERHSLWLATIVFLLCRLFFPVTGAPTQIILCGIGMAMFLVLFSYAMSKHYAFLKGDIGTAAGIAILVMIALRSWGSSVDISIEGFPLPVGGVIVLIAALLLFIIMKQHDKQIIETSPVSLSRLPAVTGLFCSFSMMYLVLSSPAVVCAWLGYERLDNSYSFFIFAGILSIIITLILLQYKCPTPLLLLPLNAIFTVLLASGLFLSRPVLPGTVESPATYVSSVPDYLFLLLFGMFSLSGVVPATISGIATVSFGERPRHAIIPIVSGMVLLVCIAMLLIATNIWGYIPFGLSLRNQFYLPFLLTGMGVCLPCLFIRTTPAVTDRRSSRWLMIVAIGIAFFALSGGFIRNHRINPNNNDTTPITIMTYNMQQGSLDNGNRSYEQQLALLRRVNPDILGLQECDTARPSGGNVDAVRYFAESMGYGYMYYGPNTVAGTFGTAILSRYPISNCRTFFTYSDTDEIGTAACDIDIQGKTVLFLCCHPAGTDDSMKAFVDALLKEQSSYEHIIALGDFNFRPTSTHYQRVISELKCAAEEVGDSKINFHGGKRDMSRKIDHIFLSDNLSAIESHYLPPPDSKTDHPAHWSVIRFHDAP